MTAQAGAFLAALSAGVPTGWRWQAACLGTPIEVFFPPLPTGGAVKQSAWAEARTICGRCPVRAECRAAADHEERGPYYLLTRRTSDFLWGMRGGEAPDERRARRRREQRDATAARSAGQDVQPQRTGAA